MKTEKRQNNKPKLVENAFNPGLGAGLGLPTSFGLLS